MANPPEGLSDDFLEQILALPSAYAASDSNLAVLQLSSAGESSGHVAGPGVTFSSRVFPLGLSLEQGFPKPEDSHGSGKRFLDDTEGKATASGKMEREPVHLGSLFPTFGHIQQPQPPPPPPPPHSLRPNPPSSQQHFHGQANQGPVPVGPHPPAIRPRVRARRGQATDPHSIAERLRRERIAERMKALQELVPSSNKTDRAAMLDEIVDYVKFLRLQVKVLSMSRLGAAGAVAQLVADSPLQSVEVEACEGGSNMRAWEKWSSDGTERQVAKLMEEDVGAAMQFLQSKALCIMPISLATAIYHTHQPETPSLVKPEPNAPS